MSDILYPDNRPRGERVTQLLSQIASIKTMASVTLGDSNEQLKTAQAKLPNVLHSHGLKSFDDLRDQLKKTMPDDARKRYEEMVKEFKDKDETENKVMNIFEYIAFFGGLGGSVAKVTELMVSGQVAIAMGHVLNGLSTAGKDTARALQFLESAAMVLKSASETWELSEKTLKAIKIVKVVGEVLAVVSLIVDGIILIIAAIEGAKQRTALEDAIHDLAYNRICAQTIQCFGSKYSHFISSMYATVNVMTLEPVEGIDKIIAKLAETFCKDVKESLENLTFDTVYGFLKMLDKDQPPAYKGDNAEPDEAALRKWWDSGKAPDFRYKGPVPKHG